MNRTVIALPVVVLTTLFAVAGEGQTQPFVPDLRHFSAHKPMLADAVRSADVIFSGVTTKVDLSKYKGIGKGTYSGTLTPKTFLKGSLRNDSLGLEWEPSATGIEAGSNHIFFVRTKGENLVVVKEIYVHKPPHMWSRTYWAYDGGTEATLQTIRLLVAPTEPVDAYAATLLADLKQPNVHRQATAVMLACETMRPECLEPLLYAVTNHVEEFEHAIFGACRLDGKQVTPKALALLTAHPEESLIFDAIASAKSPESIGTLTKFGTDNPKHRVSCAFAIREIDSSTLAEVVRTWRGDGKHAEIKHTFYRIGWRVDTFTADALLSKALIGEKVFDRE